MPSRPEMVRKIHLSAFAAITAAGLPEGITPEEQAEGLVSFAMALLRHQNGPEAAVGDCCAMAEKHKHPATTSYYYG